MRYFQLSERSCALYALEHTSLGVRLGLSTRKKPTQSAQSLISMVLDFTINLWYDDERFVNSSTDAT